jgi:hypothetical protein
MSESKHEKSQDSIVSELKAYEMRISTSQSDIATGEKDQNTVTINGAMRKGRLHISKQGYVSNINAATNT